MVFGQTSSDSPLIMKPTFTTKAAMATTTSFDLESISDHQQIMKPDITVEFDLTKALMNLNLRDIHLPNRSYTKTPSVSPVKARRLNSMNGDYGGLDCSNSSSPPNLLEILSPVSASSSSSSSSSSNVFDDLDSACSSCILSTRPAVSSSPCGAPSHKEQRSACYLSLIHTTIYEEAVEMTLKHDRTMNLEQMESEYHCKDDAANHTPPSLNSSIVLAEPEDMQTPVKIDYCGIIWPCCHSTTNVLVDDGLHSKICASLAMEEWNCWQTTYQASPSPLGVQRSYRYRGLKKLDSLKRTLIPFEPKKTQSFSPCLNDDPSFESGYDSDPEIHLVNKISSSTPNTLRATTIDELFNERLQLVVHLSSSSKVATFWLERGMAGLAIPPQMCWYDGIRRTAIPILEITKILPGLAAGHSIPASALRCFRITISDGTTYTLEAPSVPMQRDLTALLKTTVATLAAAVLTHGNVDAFFVRKEAWI